MTHTHSSDDHWDGDCNEDTFGYDLLNIPLLVLLTVGLWIYLPYAYAFSTITSTATLLDLWIVCDVGWDTVQRNLSFTRSNIDYSKTFFVTGINSLFNSQGRLILLHDHIR